MARIDNPEYAAALAAANTLREHGHQAVFAGGCVRDLLLGAEPRDWDVATDARPEQVPAYFPQTEAVGAHFGVILVLTEFEGKRLHTEVATYRHDVGYSDGRHPAAVRYSNSPEEDVLRRDFTVNGLLLDPFRFEAGEPLESCVLDFVGGRADLNNKVLRAIGDPVRRFGEDKLRLLRAVRFAACLGLEIEPVTLAAMQHEAANIEIVSCERIREELTRVLTQGAARRGFELLDATDLLVHVLPEVARMKGVEQPPQFHPEGDVWTHTLMLLDHLPKAPQDVEERRASATLAWGMLLHDVGKPATFTPPDPNQQGDRIHFNGHVEIGVAIARDILNRLRFSNEDKEQILALIKHHMQFGDVEKMKQSTLKKFLRLPRFDEHLALHRADCLSSHGRLACYDLAKRQLEVLGHEEIRPRLLLTGGDLIAAGYKPGPQFRAMLEAAEDAQLEGALTSREDALALIEQGFGPPLRTACGNDADVPR